MTMMIHTTALALLEVWSGVLVCEQSLLSEMNHLQVRLHRDDCILLRTMQIVVYSFLESEHDPNVNMWNSGKSLESLGQCE